MDGTIGKSPYLNGHKIWFCLRENPRWLRYLPNEFAAGTSKFTLDLVNSWSGGDLQSFVVGVSKAVHEELSDLRAAAV